MPVLPVFNSVLRQQAVLRCQFKLFDFTFNNSSRHKRWIKKVFKETLVSYAISHVNLYFPNCRVELDVVRFIDLGYVPILQENLNDYKNRQELGRPKTM